jgi:transcriptional regulator with XRE-family HTH domain
MMGNTNTLLIQMSDTAIVKHVGSFIKHIRQQQHKTQTQLAEIAGLNRWTISQIENGESITLMSLIQILRALNSLHVLESFHISDEISPLEYAKLKKKQRRRIRNSASQIQSKEDIGW